MSNLLALIYLNGEWCKGPSQTLPPPTIDQQIKLLNIFVIDEIKGKVKLSVYSKGIDFG